MRISDCGLRIAATGYHRGTEITEDAQRLIRSGARHAQPRILFQAFSEALRVPGVGLGVGDGFAAGVVVGFAAGVAVGFAPGVAVGVTAGFAVGVAAGAGDGVASGGGNVNGVGKSGTGFARMPASNASSPVVDLFRSV